jgi:cytochrome c553
VLLLAPMNAFFLRTLALVALAVCPLLSHAAPKAFEDTIAQRTQACTACHGDQGRAGPDGYYPRLAGKPAGYLYKQLLNFREGRRHYAPMNALLAPLSDSYLLEIAQHFAQQEAPYPTPPATTAPAHVLDRGKLLVTRGDTARKVPACVQCHGEKLTGAEPGVPGLLGLPRDYLIAQLGGWQTGQRRAHAPDCMGEVARQLSGADVAAVTHWLSAQPVPRDSHPQAALPPDVSRPPCGSTPTPTPIEIVQAPAPEATPVAKGAYLARAGNCMGCHTTAGGSAFAGGRAIQTPFGAVYSSNLTPDDDTGLGRWTATDFWHAMHEGRSKDGRLLNPAFPYTSFSAITRADSDALLAYFKSQVPVQKLNRPHDLRWPFGTQLALRAWRTLYFKATPYAVNDKQTAEWNRGAYLVQGLGHCAACHSPRDALGGLASKSPLSGGDMPGGDWYAPSLQTSTAGDPSAQAQTDLLTLLRTGVSPGRVTSGPMAEVVMGSTQHLSPTDLKSIVRYLSSLPADAQKQIPPATRPAPAAQTKTFLTGNQLFEKNCAQCHGAQGEGVVGAYPALRGTPAVNRDRATNLIQAVLHGGFSPSTQGNPRPYGMPPYQILFSDREVASVLTYVRQSWGNQGSPVSELDVYQVRERSAR